jgi:hypothetical protein
MTQELAQALLVGSKAQQQQALVVPLEFLAAVLALALAQEQER